MSYPYGKREKLKIVWEDAAHNTNAILKKDGVTFVGTKKHCAEQAIRWLIQKEFTDPVNVFMLSMKIDFVLFGRVWRMIEKEKEKAMREEKTQILGQQV